MNIGKSVKQAMFSRDLTGREVAIDLNVTTSTVSHWRKNISQNGNTIIKLANYFDMKVSDFIALGE